MPGQGYRERDSRERDYRRPEREPRDFRGRDGRDPRDRGRDGRDGRDGREMRDQRMDYPPPRRDPYPGMAACHIVAAAWAWDGMLLRWKITNTGFSFSLLLSVLSIHLI